MPREGGSSSGVLGTHDDYNLHWGHRLLSHYLHEAGIAHEHRENPETMVAARTRAIRWHCNGSGKSWKRIKPH